MDVDWAPHGDAEAFVTAALAALLARSPRLRAFADEVHTRTSTRLVDWVDHLTAPEVEPCFEITTVDGLHRHIGAQLPALVDETDSPPAVMLRVDDADAFAAVHGGQVAGGRGAALRSVISWTDQDVQVGAIERRSWVAGRTPAQLDADERDEARRLWQARPRGGGVGDGMAAALDTAKQMVRLVGTDLAACFAMEGERAYWLERNRAGRLQLGRQNALGLGWANHDHHTFRSSRSAFGPLLEILETLGFRRRERFFAGAEAGWGAQVLEQPGAGLVVFADVDLTPDEVDVDFTAGLSDGGDHLGTVGLWCALHGESVLDAGLHHLACSFDHEALVADLAALGISHRPPFSTMPHLWQAFTEAEPWRVDPTRLAALVARGQVTAADADRFAASGAPGSHLENLQRAGGFKGFNQHNVSQTIADTDPRAYRVD